MQEDVIGAPSTQRDRHNINAFAAMWYPVVLRVQHLAEHFKLFARGRLHGIQRVDDVHDHLEVRIYLPLNVFHHHDARHFDRRQSII